MAELEPSILRQIGPSRNGGAVMNWLATMVVLCTVVLGACAPASPSTPGSTAQGPAPSRAPSGPKILVAAINEDPRNFWDGINGGGGSGARQLGHMVNQYLAV